MMTTTSTTGVDHWGGGGGEHDGDHFMAPHSPALASNLPHTTVYGEIAVSGPVKTASGLLRRNMAGDTIGNSRSLSGRRAATIKERHFMISCAINRVYRFALSALYPTYCTVEKSLGIHSDAAAVAVWHADRLLVVRHSYKPGLGLPGGTLRLGESPPVAAARELYEEVGIRAHPEALTLVRSSKRREGQWWLFEYRPATLPKVLPDQREVVAARFVRRCNLPSSLSPILGQRT